MLALNMLCVAQLICIAGIYHSNLQGYYIFREQKRMKTKQPVTLRNSEQCAEIQLSLKLICQFAIWVIPDL